MIIVRFMILMVVTLKITVFWDVILCSFEDRYLWYLSINLYIIIFQKTVIFHNVHILGTKVDYITANRTRAGKKVIRKRMGRQKKLETFQTLYCTKWKDCWKKEGRGRWGGGGEKGEKTERSVNRRNMRRQNFQSFL